MSLPLPWTLLAAATAAAAIASGGYAAGHRAASSACDADKLASQVSAQQHEAAAVAKAKATSDVIWQINLDYSVVAAVLREHTIIRTQEVTYDVDTHPDLDRCIVPAITRGVRDEQVRDSARIAAGDPAVRR